MEEKLRGSSRAVGIDIKDMPLPANCVIAAIIRKSEVVVPRGDLSLQADDEILAIVDDASIEALRSYLS